MTPGDCSSCHGTGRIQRATCAACHGSGYQQHKTTTIPRDTRPAYRRNEREDNR